MTGSNGDTLLEIGDMTLTFKGVAALTRVSCTVPKGAITSLIGPNGAGKTSMLNCISGRYVPDSGSITMGGRKLLGVPPHKRTAFGLARTFQNIALFKGLSVLDNLMTGRHSRMDYGLIASIFYFGKARREEAIHRERVEQIIDFLGLSPYRHSIAGHLLRCAEKGGARPRTGRRAGTHPAGRTHGGHEPRRDRGHGPLHPRHKRGMGRHGLSGGARHGRGHGYFGQGRGPRLRPRAGLGRADEVRSNPKVVSAYLGDDDGVHLGR
ncbi:ATP-binding cassette domain-containing protein [Salidesulfovibrio brasiliensis]|uniref:ATP-binding cassette domain-containing protein n=1 Tax=Salidesulfovibrio brasiliensis TaxID=221711 RepID=UPI000AA7552A